MRRSVIAPGLLLLICLCAAQTPESRFLRPSQNSILEAGPLTIVARGSAKAILMLDGKPLAGSTPGPGAVTATITPAAGRHELSIRDEQGTGTIVFFVRSSNQEPPAAFKSFRVHPPPNLNTACQTCHVVKNGEWAFAGAASSCFGCHRQDAFSTAHTHEPPVLRDCQMCHSPHGSTEAKHLKLPAKPACEQCHPL